jgi:hypothetical protein
VGEMPFECYRKGLVISWAEDTISRWLIMRTGTKLNDCGPYRNMFFASVTMTWRPFRARRPGGRFPRLKPWAERREDKECMGSFRPETEGHGNLAQDFNPLTLT